MWFLQKVRGGFCYPGVSRLEKTCTELHDVLKATDDLKKIANLFDIVYEKVQLFKEKYQEVGMILKVEIFPPYDVFITITLNGLRCRLCD